MKDIESNDYWKKYSDFYIAQGGEKFITIGLFEVNPLSSKKAHQNTIFNGSNTITNIGYVLIDNIVISKCTPNLNSNSYFRLIDGTLKFGILPNETGTDLDVPPTDDPCIPPNENVTFCTPDEI